MFDVVADVAKYSQFVPWCTHSHVLFRNDQRMDAELGQYDEASCFMCAHKITGFLLEDCAQRLISFVCLFEELDSSLSSKAMYLISHCKGHIQSKYFEFLLSFLDAAIFHTTELLNETLFSSSFILLERLWSRRALCSITW